MGASEFSTIQTGRTPQAAFEKAREHYLYLYGHAGYTGTIAEKGEFKLMGKVSSRHLDMLNTYIDRTLEWHWSTRKNKAASPKGVPASIAPILVKAMDMYVDKSAPAVCIEITGTRAKQIKADMGRKGTMDKVFWFGGTATS